MALDEDFLVHPDEIPLPTTSSIKHEIYLFFVAEWNKRWKDTTRKPKCAATKDWFPSINPRHSYQLMNGRSRYEYSVLLQAITGHNHLAYHESKMDDTIDPKCTLCKKEGTKETTRHFLTECDALAAARLRTFGTHTPAVPYTFTIAQVTNFLKTYTSEVGWLPADEMKILGAEEEPQPKSNIKQPKDPTSK